MKRAKHRKIFDAHVRLYRYELDSPAYRTLSTDARALLIEFRALYSGGANEVFLSVRQMMERTGMGQRRAQSARDELIERGWVLVIEASGFNRKTKTATTYALTNEPLTDADGAVAPKDFMRWRPDQKFTAAKMTTHGSQDSYRDPQNAAPKTRNSSQDSYRERRFSQSTVAKTATQILLPGGASHMGCEPEGDAGFPASVNSPPSASR